MSEAAQQTPEKAHQENARPGVSLAEGVFWAGWLAAILPLGVWWVVDNQSWIAPVIFPGWATWLGKGLFVMWGAIWVPAVAIVIGGSAMIVLDGCEDSAPDPLRFFAVVLLAVIVEAITALAAFGSRAEHVRPWSPGAAALVAAVWLASVVASFAATRARSPIVARSSLLKPSKAG